MVGIAIAAMLMLSAGPFFGDFMANSRLRIGYAESSGLTSERSIEPIRLASGRLTAYDHSDDTVRTFAVSRITGAIPT